MLIRVAVPTLAMAAMTGCVAVSDSAAQPAAKPAPNALPELNWTPGSDWLNVRDFGARGRSRATDCL
jgi:hypothetical protein